MPTEKRARQRAARYEKQAELQKRQKRRRSIRRGLSILLLMALVLVIVLVLSNTSGKKPTASGKTTTTKSVATTTTPSTQPLTSAAVVPTCPAATESKRVVWFTKAPPHCVASNSIWDATFNTSVGKYVVQMDASKSYAAVNNFVFLARWNYFNGTFFHRVIPGFVIQGGDPAGTGTGGTHQFPGYSYTGNTPPAACKTAPKTAGCYVAGDLVMANSSGPSTNGSQFFVVLPGGQNTLNKEPNYTLFGKVISGMTAVDKIGSYGSSSGAPSVKVYLLGVTVKQTNG